VKNILQGIEASRSAPFERVLFAIGIRFVGEVTAKKLARKFKSMDNIVMASKEELMEVDDVGERVASSIVSFFEDDANRDIIVRLHDAGLCFEIDTEEDDENTMKFLEGKTVVVSGVFSISRDEIKAMVEKYGGKNTSSISKNTSFVLAGEKMGPEKRKKAESLGIPIVSEDEFMEMFNI
jgi:DNA ligase (NAD+)